MTQARVDEIKEDYLKVSGSVQWEGRKEGEGEKANFTSSPKKSTSSLQAYETSCRLILIKSSRRSRVT